MLQFDEYKVKLNNLRPELDDLDQALGLEAAIRRDFFKLMSSQSQVAAKAAGRAVDVSADDFNDED